MPRRCATAAFVALVLTDLPIAAHGNEITIQYSDPAEAAEGTATDTEAREPNTEELLESLLLQLRCMALQHPFNKELAARPGLGESYPSESELTALFKPPDVYRSGIGAQRLGAVAAQIAGSDRSGALDGSRAMVKGLPPPLAVSGWGHPSTPLIAYVPRTETPLHLVRDMSGAGALVVDGDLNVWGSFRYVGLLVVLGGIEVTEDAELSVNGLPLFAGELKVRHRGRLQIRARDADLGLIRRTLAGRVQLRQLPLPQIKRVEGPAEEQDCPSFFFGM